MPGRKSLIIHYRVLAISAHGTSPPSHDVPVRTPAVGPDEQATEPTADPESVSEGDADLPNDNSTPGRVAVGGSATGSIGTAGDQDRFAVELEADRTYRFDLTGSPGGGGTLPDTFLRAIYDSAGQYQPDSYNDDFEDGRDSRVTFTVSESGTYYARVSGKRDETGSYTLSVTDVTPEPEAEPPAKPTGLSAVATHDTVTLSWDDPQDDGITGYVILRHDKEIHEEETFVTVESDTASADTTHTDDTVEPEKQYVYRIKALNEHGESEISDWVRADTPVAPAPEPTPAASQRRSVYIDAHNAGVRDLEEFRPRPDGSDLDREADEGGEDRQAEAGNQGKSVGARQGRNITPRATVNICNRTPEVEAALLELIRASAPAVTCATVTDDQLAEIDRLVIEDGYSSPSIVPSDFVGLTELTWLEIENSQQLERVPANAFESLNNLGTLRLDSNGLKTLYSDSFSGLSNLKYLFLWNNALTYLPEDVFDGLGSLDRLYLYQNDLTWLPEDVFDGLSSLTLLQFYENDFTSLHPDIFDGLNKLRTLSMRDNNLGSLHADIFDGLDALNWLDLSDNRLSSLPEGIFDGLPLTKLHLDGNQFTSLRSDTFSDLTKLTTLGVGNNDLGSLPEGIFDGLYDLGTLRLTNIGITELPDGIFANLESLVYLFLNENADLTSLDENIFDGMSSLERLWMGDNGLTSLDENIFDGMSSLEWLFLDGNSLTSLDENIFDGMSSLERLWLDRNSLTALPAGIFADLGGDETETGYCYTRAQPGLSELILGDNDFSGSSLPEGVFIGLDCLVYLLLHRAELDTLPASLFDPLTGLWLLYLHGNKLITLPEDIFAGPSSLARLYLYDNDLTELPVDVFDGLVYLQRLYLDGNELATLDKDVFDELRGLQRLYLYSNLLTTLDGEVFEGLDRDLADLYLQDNRLTALPGGVFNGLTGLKELDLSCNELTALDLDLFDPFAGTLSYLDLDANSFTTPPTEAAVRAKLTALQALYLTGAGPCLPAFGTGLSALSLSTGTLSPAFVLPGIGSTDEFDIGYEGMIGNHDSLTITTNTINHHAKIGSSPLGEVNDSDNDPRTGIEVDLRKTRTEVWWRVTAENGSTYQDYAVDVFREHLRYVDARLDRLELSSGIELEEDLELSPGFHSGTYEYETLIFEDSVEVEVSVATLDAEATVTIQLDGRILAYGVMTAKTTMTVTESSIITVEVTAEDGVSTLTYNVRPQTPPSHTHQEFTHGHAHAKEFGRRGRRYYTEDYSDHTHPGHKHADEFGHPSTGRHFPHVHHAQEKTGEGYVSGGPDLRTHDHLTHTHICRDIKAACIWGGNFNSGTYGGTLPREVTHAHEDAEPGHGYDWSDLTANGNRPAEGEPYVGHGTWRVPVGTTLSVDLWRVSDPDGMSNATLRYQWLADYTEISGATGSNHTVTAAEVGKTVRVRVSFTDDAGHEEVLRSRNTLKVEAGGP